MKEAFFDNNKTSITSASGGKIDDNNKQHSSYYYLLFFYILILLLIISSYEVLYVGQKKSHIFKKKILTFNIKKTITYYSCRSKLLLMKHAQHTML
jgi:hypothetical protein